MINFTQFLNESALNAIEFNKTYVFVMGGSGSGKNYTVQKYFPEHEHLLIDVDEVIKKYAKPGEDTKPYVQKAIDDTNRLLSKAFESGESVIQTGTGGNAKGLENRIKKAKSFGYHVILILVDTSVDKAYKQIQNRVKSGGHGFTLTKDKIQRTNEKARNSFDTNKRIADENYVVKNKRIL